MRFKIIQTYYQQYNLICEEIAENFILNFFFVYIQNGNELILLNLFKPYFLTKSSFKVLKTKIYYVKSIHILLYIQIYEKLSTKEKPAVSRHKIIQIENIYIRRISQFSK